jgi:hypothetical protein
MEQLADCVNLCLLPQATALQEKVEANPVDDTLDAFKGVPAGQEAAAPEVWAAFKEACYAGVEAKPAKAAAKRKQAPEVGLLMLTMMPTPLVAPHVLQSVVAGQCCSSACQAPGG